LVDFPELGEHLPSGSSVLIFASTPRQRGMHSVKKADILAMKIDFVLKKFEDYSQDKAQMQTLQVLETRMTCEVYGDVGHSGDNCLETQEEALYLNGNNNEFRPQEG